MLDVLNEGFVHLVLELLGVPRVECYFIFEFAFCIRLEILRLVLPEAFGEHFSEEGTLPFGIDYAISHSIELFASCFLLSVE